MNYRSILYTNTAYPDGDRLEGTNPNDYAVPAVSNPGDLLFAILYNINSPPVTTNAQASIGTLWPATNNFVNESITGVTDPDGDPLTITITSITSDEPTTLGSKVFAPDAIIGTGGSFQLRAERNGKGDGRVYIINFTASDGQGGVTPGSVKVGVPLKANRTAVDSRGVLVMMLRS